MRAREHLVVEFLEMSAMHFHERAERVLTPPRPIRSAFSYEGRTAKPG